MKTVLICYSDAGAALALRLKELLGEEVTGIHSNEKFAVKYGFVPHVKLSSDIGGIFSSNDALIFICACGIAVRTIAPYIADKTVDPAVVVMDDQGKFAIPVLSGHIGGANALAGRIAEMTGAIPVITTATDGRGRFSCDRWAKEHGCAVSSMENAKRVSAAILTANIPVSSGYPLPDELPAGLTKGEGGELGIYIGVDKKEPYDTTLRLVPRIVTVGIGCRRGISAQVIREAVKTVFGESGVDTASICGIASIDVKKDEIGLLEFAGESGLPIAFHSAEELESVEGEFEESEFVKKTVGVGNVCERAAAFDGGEMIIRKTAMNGVTVAAAAGGWRIEF